MSLRFRKVAWNSRNPTIRFRKNDILKIARFFSQFFSSTVFRPKNLRQKWSFESRFWWIFANRRLRSIANFARAPSAARLCFWEFSSRNRPNRRVCLSRSRFRARWFRRRPLFSSILSPFCWKPVFQERRSPKKRGIVPTILRLLKRVLNFGLTPAGKVTNKLSTLFSPKMNGHSEA